MEEDAIKRIPPHNAEAERAVISSMMMDGDAVLICSEILSPGDFYDGHYAKVFEALVELYRNGITRDLVMLQNKLREMGLSPAQYSTQFLRELMLSETTSAHVKHYADIVYEKAVARRLISVSKETQDACYSANRPFDEVLDTAEKHFFDVVQQRNAGDFEPIMDIAARTLAEVEKASEQKGHITGLATGFTDLDVKLSGLQKSDLILVAARPSMGKTAFALNIVYNIIMNSQSVVALFSLEMSKEQLVKRMFSMDARVDSQKLRTGEMEEGEWARVVESVRRISHTQLVLDDISGATAAEVRTKCRKLKLTRGLDLVVIDYLQLMSASSGKKNENRQQEISEISRALKVMARELEVPVIAVSQLSRAVEQRPDKHPMLSDLRESGAIEQDADVVIFLYRDEYYNAESEEKGVAEVMIAKQRNGPTGRVRLAWLQDLTKFGNLEPSGGF